MILLAKNEEGLKNLYKLCFYGQRDGQYYKPRIDKKLLTEYSKGIICSAACIMGVAQRKIISLDCELHSDCAEELVAAGSKYVDLWGANIYPKEKKIDFISLINIRPLANNRSMDIENPDIKKRVEDIIKSLLF